MSMSDSIYGRELDTESQMSYVFTSQGNKFCHSEYFCGRGKRSCLVCIYKLN